MFFRKHKCHIIGHKKFKLQYLITIWYNVTKNYVIDNITLNYSLKILDNNLY